MGPDQARPGLLVYMPGNCSFTVLIQTFYDRRAAVLHLVPRYLLFCHGGVLIAHPLIIVGRELILSVRKNVVNVV